MRVVAAEALRHQTKACSTLSVLPVQLLELVCARIARDSRKGYLTLQRLKKEVPDLEISTPAWLDAIKASEQRTRDFTYVCSFPSLLCSPPPSCPLLSSPLLSSPLITSRSHLFYQSKFLGGYDHEQPLIDVFSEIKSFIIEPSDEYEVCDEREVETEGEKEGKIEGEPGTEQNEKINP